MIRIEMPDKKQFKVGGALAETGLWSVRVGEKVVVRDGYYAGVYNVASVVNRLQGNATLAPRATVVILSMSKGGLTVREASAVALCRKRRLFTRIVIASGDGGYAAFGPSKTDSAWMDLPREGDEIEKDGVSGICTSLVHILPLGASSCAPSLAICVVDDDGAMPEEAARPEKEKEVKPKIKAKK